MANKNFDGNYHFLVFTTFQIAQIFVKKYIWHRIRISDLAFWKPIIKISLNNARSL